jgi:16S rRNA (cytidine1402-2'-O)-methyltransferase
MSDSIGKLFIVGTPIGNLGDMTHRAVEILRSVDIIACEDTRTSRTLLNKYLINKPLIAHHSKNERDSTQGIVKLLSEGKNIGIITDSGMPSISDPGAMLVSAVRDAGFDIDVIPGVSSLTTAVSLAGVTAPWIFAGYTPATPKMRRRKLRSLSNIDMPIIFFEAPHRIGKFIEDIIDILGDRPVFLLRELTKIHQQVISSQASHLLELADDNKFRGELVMIIMPEPIDVADKNSMIPDDLL